MYFALSSSSRINIIKTVKSEIKFGKEENGYEKKQSRFRARADGTAS